MFVSHSIFKHPLQLDPDATNWVSVELGLAIPWFIATLLDHNETVHRNFLLLQEDLLLRLTEKQGLGELVALQLVRPPAWSGTDAWTMSPIVKVERPASASDRPMPCLYLTSEDELIFAGFPFEPTDAAPADLLTCWIRPSAN